MATSNPSESVSALAGQVAAGLAQMGIALKRQSRRRAERYRLSPTQSQILAFLRSHPRQAITLTAIAEWFAITPATASEAVQKLKEKGLLRKMRSHSDARTVCITLSTKGWQKTKGSHAQHDIMTVAVDALTSMEQAVFLRALFKMVQVLQTKGEVPVSRMCSTCHHFGVHPQADSRNVYHCTFFDAIFEDRLLRIDCSHHKPAKSACPHHL